MTGVANLCRKFALLLAAATAVDSGDARAQAQQRDLLPQTFLDRQPAAQATDADAAQKDARRRAAEESRRLAEELAREKAEREQRQKDDTRPRAATTESERKAPEQSSPAITTEPPAAIAVVPQPVPAARPLQNLAPQAAPAQAAPSQPPAQNVSPAERDRLIAQGEKRLKEGDIASARLFYQRAAETGSATAARILGRLFDATALAALGVRGVAGDAEKATYWLGYADKLDRGETPTSTGK